MREIQFVDYDGRYPNLCSGILTISVDGQNVSIGNYGAISSGGSVSFDADWCEHVTSGEWSLGYADEYEQFTDEEKRCILYLVNCHVPEGCCGGCV